MKRRVTPFSIGLSLGLLTIAAGILLCVSHMHHAAALSASAPDNADFYNGGTGGAAHYTLSDTVDVANATTMTAAIFTPNAKPSGNTVVSVSYEGNVSSGPACDDNNHQGWSGATFTYGSGDTGASGIPTRQTTITIPSSAWQADGTGWKVDITGTLLNKTHDCGSAGGDGNHVNFDFNAPSSFIVGPAGGKRFGMAMGSYCIAYNSTYPSGVTCAPYENYNIPFAPDCTMNSFVSKSVQIYDMDNDGTHPIIQPGPSYGNDRAIVQIVDTTTGAVVNNNSFSGGEGNGQTATFSFTITPHHKYALKINHANKNNILQMSVPYDSVGAQVNCAPEGGIVSSVAQSCPTSSGDGDIRGWAYDQNSPATQLRLYIYTNPSGTPDDDYATVPSDPNFYGAFTANLPNPSGTPGSVPVNHGYDFNIPSQVRGYNGPWVDNTFYIYAKDLNNSHLIRVASITVPAGTCATMSCGSTNFALDAVGSPDTFTVSAKMNGTTIAPPGNPTFTVKITGVGTGTNSQTFNGVADTSPSGSTIFSVPITFTPSGAGTYNITWSYYGVGGCGDSSDARYTPYFNVLGGDIAAGVGFGNGSCGENLSTIESWNQASPNFFGAGSSIGVWATNNIKDFASGLGLSGGGAAQSGHGLSFANISNGMSNVPPNYGGGFGVGSVPCVDDYYGTKAAANPQPVQTNLPSGIFNNLASGAYETPAGSNVTLGENTHVPLTVDQGKTITLYVQGNVYIDSDITYANYTATTVPRFNLFVSGNIYIDPNVTELHGLYVAQKSASLPGDIDTCATGPSAAQTKQSYDTCAQHKLLVVGSMDAQGKLRLARTYGNLVGVPAAGVTNEPAETFQYSPELWMNAPPLTGLAVKAYTSLPPVL